MYLLKVIALLSLSALGLAGDCEAGIGSDECVSVFADGGCGSYETSYRPTCEGNCYRYPFKGLKVKGNSFRGTNCVAYYDDNCQQAIASTGNQYGESDCVSFDHGGGAQSMQCYFDC
ncbi:hypothetical protein FGG08_004763 [Glutinoglossum americanum]|uniref:Uncharacterized protein n=1 Tax=Glutinoglossum americanum TaxID=1670608 RepID=A0A9P8I6W7_9PEZI|nr:hypothetical protein FGG08_004763 [Glutinoglossum americanum]